MFARNSVKFQFFNFEFELLGNAVPVIPSKTAGVVAVQNNGLSGTEEWLERGSCVNVKRLLVYHLHSFFRQ
jgi:hypothetical protein